MMTRTPFANRPLDPRQFCWWHRLRAHGRFVFIVVYGTLGIPALVVAMNGFIRSFAFGWQPERMMWLFLALSIPITVAHWATWWYMEKRYDATSGLRCPRCGQLLIGVGSGRCPECGAAFVEARA